MCYSRGITEDKYGIMIYFHAGHYMEVEFRTKDLMWKTYDQLMKLLEPKDILPIIGDMNKENRKDEIIMKNDEMLSKEDLMFDMVEEMKKQNQLLAEQNEMLKAEISDLNDTIYRGIKFLVETIDKRDF